MAPVVGKLAGKPLQFLEIWESTCGGAEFMRHGVLGYWKDPIASPARLIAEGGGYQRKFAEHEEVEFFKLLQKQLDDGTVVEVPDDWPAYTCPVHTVPKKGGKWRLVWDGRAVNAEQVSVHFRMEGPETVQDVMKKGDWGAKIDLESAFNHVWVSTGMQRFFCFRYDGKSYAYVGMPFGSKHAPRLFTEALGYAIRYIRLNWDVRIIVYMDDILILQQDQAKCELYALQIAAYLQCLGWTLSVKKCVFEPSQEIEFLGWLWNTVSLSLEMTVAMRGAILQLVRTWLGRAWRGDSVSSKEFGGLIGSLNFLRAQVPRASLNLRG
jgi:hypothetical protein